MNHSARFFRNADCEWFPCHNVENDDDFNCLFCYCPLYLSENCGGNYRYTETSIKDCSLCTLPHQAENYDYILAKLQNKP